MNNKNTLLYKEKQEIKTLVEAFEYTEYITHEDANLVLDILENTDNLDNAIIALENILTDGLDVITEAEYNLSESTIEQDSEAEYNLSESTIEQDSEAEYNLSESTIEQDLEAIVNILLFANVSKDKTANYIDSIIRDISNIVISKYDLFRVYNDYNFSYKNELKKRGVNSWFQYNNSYCAKLATGEIQVYEKNTSQVQKLCIELRKTRNILGRVYHAIVYLEYNGIEISIGYNNSNKTMSYSKNGRKIRFVNIANFEESENTGSFMPNKEKMIDTLKMLLNLD